LAGKFESHTLSDSRANSADAQKSGTAHQPADEPTLFIERIDQADS
jgi:hypothetical protein